MILVSRNIRRTRIFAGIPRGGASGVKRQWGCRQRKYSIHDPWSADPAVLWICVPPPYIRTPPAAPRRAKRLLQRLPVALVARSSVSSTAGRCDLRYNAAVFDSVPAPTVTYVLSLLLWRIDCKHTTRIRQYVRVHAIGLYIHTVAYTVGLHNQILSIFR